MNIKLFTKTLITTLLFSLCALMTIETVAVNVNMVSPPASIQTNMYNQVARDRQRNMYLQHRNVRCAGKYVHGKCVVH